MKDDSAVGCGWYVLCTGDLYHLHVVDVVVTAVVVCRCRKWAVLPDCI